MPVLVLTLGLMMGAVNGLLVGVLRLPSIIVTLAMMVAWRDALRWTTEGAWVQDLPADFQWFGLASGTAQFLIVSLGIILAAIIGWALRNLTMGRRIYAVGADKEAARLAGIDPRVVTFCVFVVTGMLVGLGALLNAVRFSTVPSNAGTGYELQAIAAVVVGGTAITGGRGTVMGTVIGVVLLGVISTALTYVGIGPFWVKAIQGLIILAALGRRRRLHAARQARQCTGAARCRSVTIGRAFANDSFPTTSGSCCSSLSPKWRSSVWRATTSPPSAMRSRSRG